MLDFCVLKRYLIISQVTLTIVDIVESNTDFEYKYLIIIAMLEISLQQI